MSTMQENNDASKRKSEEAAEGAGPEKMQKLDDSLPKSPPMKMNPNSRGIRLEQNRKAARESRRRKKTMIEELQRSVIFFSRANGTLKQQNDELTRSVMQAQMQIAAIESHAGGNSTPPTAAAPIEDKKPEAAKPSNEDQANANAVAAQALYETNGYPAAAARKAAQAMNGNDEKQESNQPKVPVAAPTGVAVTMISPQPQTPSLPAMQPGATMQAMANFQQAAAAAMQSAMGQMQNVPGVSIQQLAAAPAGTNAQQAYTDTMTALAMQQAAAAAAAGMMQPGMQFFPFLSPWQHQQQPVQQLPNQPQETPDQDKNDFHV